MVTIVERIVFFGIDQWPYLPNALSLLGKKLFVIGKTNVIPVFIEIFVFPESINNFRSDKYKRHPWPLIVKNA